MADISSKLDKIKSAERGEDVRDAIIGALRDINNDVPADMSNPERVTADMPGSSDLTIPFNPPKLVSEIYVRQAGSGGKSTTLKDITITENGEYPTDEEDYDSSTENRYYKKVKVNVPQLANKIEMDEVVIEQNGTYSATEWGVDGLRTITVNVQGATGDGPFQVEFYDKVQSDPTATVKETQLIPKGGNVNPVYIPESPSGQVFMGWTPEPINVTRDMKCYPKFADRQVVVGEIPDSWEVICEKGGAGYALGSYKSLGYSAEFTKEECQAAGMTYPENYQRFRFDSLFYKVAEGESGSKSTWLSIPCNVYRQYSNDGVNWSGATTICTATHQSFYWPDRQERKVLNLMATKCAPSFLQHLMTVTKYTQCSTSSSAPFDIQPTADKFWVASIKEMYIDEWDTVDPSYAIDKNKYVTSVPSALAYINDILALNPQQRSEAFFLSGDCYTRDAGGIWDQSQFVSSNIRTMEWKDGETYTANIFGGGRHDGGLIPCFLGFCLA